MQDQRINVSVVSASPVAHRRRLGGMDNPKSVLIVRKPGQGAGGRWASSACYGTLGGR